MKFIHKPKTYKEKKKFLLWPRRLYTQGILHNYVATIWLEEVLWQKTSFFPLILFEDNWYTSMPVGVDIYKEWR